MHFKYTICRENRNFGPSSTRTTRPLKFSGNNILIYNDFEYTMMNHAGNIFFEGTFEESISDLYTLSGNNRYMVLHAGRTDQIRLK